MSHRAITHQPMQPSVHRSDRRCVQGPHSSGLRAQGPEQPVPVGEVGGEVVPGLEVVQVVVPGAPVQAQRHQAVRGPGQVVAAVGLHREPDVEDEEGHLGEGVAAQQDWAGCSEQAQTQGLPDPRVLRAQGPGGGVRVVQLQEEAQLRTSSKMS